jgi:hypothetical protein
MFSREGNGLCYKSIVQLGCPAKKFVSNGQNLHLFFHYNNNKDWIGLAKDRNRWRALVNSVLNLRVP